ncbi:zinc-binding dehydrogenase [Cryobacterium lyxosi]|uniref:zinc-binding dehydrogenase n=1 Tax=Cryobacterium lyxosi TaxID=1259228 RepID=UPI001F53E5D2|nr:zinc-binding dehydrogenase [Cryobacterium lyxosi]
MTVPSAHTRHRRAQRCRNLCWDTVVQRTRSPKRRSSAMTVTESNTRTSTRVPTTMHAAVVHAAFGQAIGMTRRGGTIVFNGLPPGDFPAPIFNIVLKGLTIRGSIVGTRQDMEEALQFYARGQIHPTVSERRLDEVNEVLDEMKHGKIDGRVVIRY